MVFSQLAFLRKKIYKILPSFLRYLIRTFLTVYRTIPDDALKKKKKGRTSQIQARTTRALLVHHTVALEEYYNYKSGRMIEYISGRFQLLYVRTVLVL